MAVHLGAAHRSAHGQIDINGPSGLLCACTPTEEKMQRRDASCAFQEMPREEKKKKLLGSNRLKERCSREGRLLMFEWEREDLEKQGERRSREASILWCQIWVQRRSYVGRGGERHTWPREWRSDREVTVVTETHWGEGDRVGDLMWDGADNLSGAGERIWWAGEVSAAGESRRSMVAGWGGSARAGGPMRAWREQHWKINWKGLFLC